LNRLRKSGIEEVFEPWWVTLREEEDSQEASVRTVAHVLLGLPLGKRTRVVPKLGVCRPNFVGLAEDLIERRGDHVRERFACSDSC
jgi:hypothetical protein